MSVARYSRCLLAVAVLISLLAGCQPPAVEPLQFEAARVRLPLPGTDKTVGYFEVTNNTALPIVLVSAHSEQARAVEFHTMVRDGDMLRMRRLLEVPIAAGETVSFAPGGNHLMIFGVEALADNAEIVFTAADGAQYPHTFRTFSLDEQ